MPTHDEAAQAVAKAYFGDFPKPQLETLRDKFAMAALTGILACDCNWDTHELLSSHCYKVADAMLKARDKAP